MWWSKTVEKHPFLLILTVLAVNWVLVLISLLTHSLPSFEDPLLGFEVRGSEVSKRSNSWKLLLESTSTTNSVLSLQSNDRKNTSNPESKHSKISDDEELKHIEDMESKPFRSRSHNLNKNKMFCGKILEDYVQFVVTSVDEKDLFSVNSIKTLCKIDSELLRLESTKSEHSFTDKCETRSTGQCCKSWSLHNYVVLMSNRSSCDDINELDIIAVKSRLQSCASFYHNMQINEQCLSDPGLCREVPEQCYDFENSVYNLMNYLIDYNFINPLNPNITSVKYTNIFVPIAKSTQLLQYFNDLTENELQINDLKVVAMDLGLKYALFEEYLRHDTIYLLIGFSVILFSLFVYTTSLVVTFVTVITIVTSLGTAYFFYTTVFGMTFFPFMNLLVVVIAIGIGSDNALIYCKVWNCVKSDKTSVIFIKLIWDTLSHVWVSSLSASTTTALAFFAGYFSDITSIKCFSLFASLSVAANFVITILTLPSAVIIAEKYSFKSNYFNTFWRFHSFITSFMKIFFERILLKTILRFRYIIVIIFGLISVLSVIVVVVRPKLQLPNSEEFQIFNANHFFERYDFEFKNQFWFKRTRDKNDDYLYYLPIRVVFGLQAIDNGDHFNPFTRGSLEFDKEFDISSEDSQLWLNKFCKDIRNQTFYRPTIGPLLSNCFIETFKSWMEDRQCVDPIRGFDRTPCCETSVFPFKPNVFKYCLKQVMELLAKTPNYYLSFDWAGPRYDKGSHEMVAAVIEYDSVYSFSHSFVEMNRFWKSVNDFISLRIKSAPKGLQNGWFISTEMGFYALQLSLSEGTVNSIIFAVFFSFLALVSTTWNFKLSLLSTITITAIIFSTIAVLVALNWKLNVLESITISLAIGLAIDFTLHYTIAYKLSTQHENPMNGIFYALSRIASPVAMAALTTCLAGAPMLFSSIQAYRQIGTFLIVLSTISWLFSTLFHLSLINIFSSDTTAPKTDPLLYCWFLCRDSSNDVNPSLRNSSTIESNDLVPNKRSNNGSFEQTFSVTSVSTSSPTNSAFQTQTESHELEKMIN